MQRVLVGSTTLASAGHDAKSAILELQFRSGAVYRYYDVPVAVYQRLLEAPSKGVYFNQSIRGRYFYQRIGGTLDLAGPSMPLQF
ncbi:MAG: KTSC domain-containing protein [Acidobacteria bacterium]|nr:KTSC domain-containing protein [Acidobacteriota bacterium]